MPQALFDPWVGSNSDIGRSDSFTRSRRTSGGDGDYPAYLHSYRQPREPNSDHHADANLHLAATRRLRDILSTFRVRFAVANYARDHEALYVLADETTGERELVDPAPLALEGLIGIEDLEADQETSLFVELAAQAGR